MSDSRVLIVGAGPVGMICALALNRAGVAVTVLEQEPQPVRDQRAATLHPTTLEMLDDLGVLDAIRSRGLLSAVYHFRDRISGELVAEFDLGLLSDELRFPYVLQYEQYKLTRDIAAEFANQSDFDVRYGHRVESVHLHADRVDLDVWGPDGPQRHAGRYVIGADGGRSAVRKASGIAFDGFTYPERFVKLATPFDFRLVNPGYVYRNYFSDPEEWCNLFKVRGEDDRGIWRAIFPTRPGETEEEAMSPRGIQSRLKKFFPKDDDYEIADANVYSVHQRVAATFRKGPLLLAGDAAHVNNPIGGMGMNGGIHDAVNLADKLSRVLLRGEDEALLDLYSRQRRHAAVSYIQAQTIANKKLMEERDPAVRREKLAELRRVAAHPGTARAYMRRAALVDSLHDAATIR